MGSSGPRVAEGTQGNLKMARTLSKISLILLPLLCIGSPIEAKNWRYWPNIGCYEFSFERTVFFELTNEATRLSAIAGSELPAIVNTSVVPASDNDLQLQHILAGSIKNSTTNRPEECIISCNATGFAYAGLQDGNRCVCMNEHPTAKTDGSNCNMACPGNGNFSCGGSWTMDLHQNPAYHSTNLTYIGCFKNTFNDLDRMLFEGTYNNFRNNTPDWCVAYCTSGGFDYAGLQYGSQCICTNSGPQGTSDAGQCTYGCAGDSSIKMCGGLGYINIFHTDAHKTTIDDWGCGNTVQDTYYQKWYQDMGHCNVTVGGDSRGNSGSASSGKTGRAGGNLMVLNSGDSVRTFEFYNVDNTSLPDCLQGTKEYPEAELSAMAKPALFTNPENGKPVVCGRGKCNMYEASTNTWNQIGSTLSDGSVRGWDYVPAVGLVMVGGTRSNKAEISRDNGVTFEPLPNYPMSLSGTCLVITDNTAFVTGGRDGSYEVKSNVYELDIGSDQGWQAAPSMSKVRDDHTCGEFTTSSGEKMIMVVGGSGNMIVGGYNRGNTDTVEIFSKTSREWRQANPFPRGVTKHFMTHYPFVVMGGSQSPYVAKMYSYDIDNDTWEELPTRFKRGRYTWVSALFVDDICD